MCERERERECACMWRERSVCVKSGSVKECVRHRVTESEDSECVCDSVRV